VKPGSHFTDLSSAWCLTLDLVNTRHIRCGSMTIYRLYTRRELQFDISLLISTFPAALADALDRTSNLVVEVMPKAEQHPEFAAQAS
jgi:hypothetical protein